jgi:starch-binding outer membrane protein, SusD/RagB family
MTAYITRPRPAALALVAALLAGCNPDTVLDVKDPDVVRPGNLTGKAALPALRSGVLGSFQIAFSGGGDLQNGGHEGIVQLGGLFADELINAETFSDRINLDARRVTAANGTMVALFLDLSRARAAASTASRKYAQFDAGSEGHAEMIAIDGFAHVLFGEHYCSGVPFSTITDDEQLVYGDPLTRDQMFQAAIARFDSVIVMAQALRDASLESLGRVGKGRALVNLGRWSDAAAAVTGVPTSFSFDIESSTNSDRQRNGIWHYFFNSASFSVGDREGGAGLPYVSDADPRVAAEPTGGVGFDGETPFVISAKYADAATPTVLADGIEARLIEAEATLRAGQPSLMLARLNQLRLAGGLDALADPGSAQGREALLFQERAYWLYLTAHRLGDLRRLVRQYGRTVADVYPSGEYFKGGDYGTDVVFPVSADERNNPKFQGCIDRNP